jgi:hypothetical protein
MASLKPIQEWTHYFSIGGWHGEAAWTQSSATESWISFCPDPSCSYSGLEQNAYHRGESSLFQQGSDTSIPGVPYFGLNRPAWWQMRLWGHASSQGEEIQPW